MFSTALQRSSTACATFSRYVLDTSFSLVNSELSSMTSCWIASEGAKKGGPRKVVDVWNCLVAEAVCREDRLSKKFWEPLVSVDDLVLVKTLLT